MGDDRNQHFCLVNRLEQLQTGLRNGDMLADKEARRILAGIVSRGSTAILAQTFRGIILAMDEMAEWNELI